MELLEQLLADDSLLRLVDELYFEKHGQDISAALTYFADIRRRGVRLHYWP